MDAIDTTLRFGFNGTARSGATSRALREAGAARVAASDFLCLDRDTGPTFNARAGEADVLNCGACTCLHATSSHYINGDTTAFVQFLTPYLFKDFPALKFIIPTAAARCPSGPCFDASEDRAQHVQDAAARGSSLLILHSCNSPRIRACTCGTARAAAAY